MDRNTAPILLYLTFLDALFRTFSPSRIGPKFGFSWRPHYHISDVTYSGESWMQWNMESTFNPDYNNNRLVMLRSICMLRGYGTIHKLRKQARGRGVTKCLCYYISLCSKAAYGGGRGFLKKPQGAIHKLPKQNFANFWPPPPSVSSFTT